MGLSRFSFRSSFQRIFLIFAVLNIIHLSSGDKIFVTEKYDYGVTIYLKINSSVEFIFEHDERHSITAELPAKISVKAIGSNRKSPIFVVARQQKGITSWQLPIAIDNKELHDFSRILCPNKNFFIDDNSENEYQSHPIINIYTSSPTDISFELTVYLVHDFYLNANNNNITVSVTPSAPQVLFYTFENVTDVSPTWYLSKNKRNNEKPSDLSETVIIRFDSTDNYCMLISIQNASCPIFDSENDIMFEGFYETVSKRGGITITRKTFPLGFYIVLVVKNNDEDCVGFKPNTTDHFSNFFKTDIQPYDLPAIDRNIITGGERIKTVSLIIQRSITSGQYWLAISSTLVAIAIIYIVFISGIFFYNRRRNNVERQVIDVPNTSSCSSPINSDLAVESNALLTSENNKIDNNGMLEAPTFVSVTNNDNNSVNSNDSLPSVENGKIYLNQLCQKSCKDIKRQSGLYLWHLVTIAIFYSLPVIQLVVTYQRVLNQSGNQDLCYYNFLCAHPVGLLSDFNHVYSNLGYVLLGALFMFFTWKKHQQYQDNSYENNCGIPPHHGLFYAMGVALIMEGVLSASYHVCPNHSNFQFDTSFMYIMAVLCMVKIYQTRHPDINAKAHSTFSVLAMAILICLIGVLYPNFYFWLFFTLLHISMCFVLTFQIYYMGKKKFQICCCTGYTCGTSCKPIYRSRWIMVFIANLCNWGLAIYGLYNHSKDFATHLLYVFLMNLALHLAFYIVMKLTNGERLRIYTWVLLVLALIAWGSALWFFFNPSTSWALTPAESRTYNMSCRLLNFYDYHDIWHLLSAAAMFFSFMLLLTLDDDIMDKPHTQIPVF